MKALILGFAALGLLTGPAAAAPQSKPASAARQCFFARDVTSWREVGNQAVNLQVNNRDVYRVDLFAPCPELRRAFERIGVKTRAGSDSVCTGADIDIVVPQEGGPATSCLGSNVTALSADQVKALPKRERP
jgi:hypothetical protein